MAWYWRPIRQEEDFEDARARLRELIGQSLKGGGNVEQGEAIALLTDLLEGYEVRCALEEAGEVTGATLLAAQMKRRGLGTCQFARDLGVPHARVSEVIRGERPLSRRLACALLEQGVSPMRVLAALLAPKDALGCVAALDPSSLTHDAEAAKRTHPQGGDGR